MFNQISSLQHLTRPSSIATVGLNLATRPLLAALYTKSIDMKLEDFFRIAMLKIEHCRSNIDNTELLWGDEVTLFNQLSAEEFEQAALKYINENTGADTEALGTAIFALGKSHDRQFHPTYLKVIRALINSDLNACYQAAIAIENFGERILFGADLFTSPELVKSRLTEHLVKYGV